MKLKTLTFLYDFSQERDPPDRPSPDTLDGACLGRVRAP